MTRPLVIYYDDCNDGIAAAWAASRSLSDPEYRPMSYDDDPVPKDDIQSREVFILDFSFDRGVMVEMNEAAEKLVVLDHHETARDDCEGLDFCTFDMDKSGAGLAWEYFWGEEPPKIIRYIEDRDLWKREMPHSKTINAALQSRDLAFAYLNDFHSRWPETKETLHKQGQAILRHQQTLVDRIVERAVDHQICGESCYVVNCGVLESEVGNELAEKHPNSLALMYHNIGDDQIKFSFRGQDDGPHCGKLAEEMGGGGHANAAGAVVDYEELEEEVRREE